MWGKSKEKQYEKTLEAIKYCLDNYKVYEVDDSQVIDAISLWIDESLTSKTSVDVSTVKYVLTCYSYLNSKKRK
jgi:hypothetical protein